MVIVILNNDSNYSNHNNNDNESSNDRYENSEEGCRFFGPRGAFLTSIIFSPKGPTFQMYLRTIEGYQEPIRGFWVDRKQAWGGQPTQTCRDHLMAIRGLFGALGAY